MKVDLHEVGELKFYCRPNTSDIKTVNEVVGRNVYQKKGFCVNVGERWIDCGGNIGAFTVLAASKGAKVTVYEPDPTHCKLIEANLKLNNLDAKIVCAGFIHNQQKKGNLYAGLNGNTWRNSLFKNWGKKNLGCVVDLLNFDEATIDGDCIKIDIEGAEMPILENTKNVFNKMVFEWSFDIDSSLVRFWAIVEKLKETYDLDFPKSSTRYDARDFEHWQPSWFPACVNVFCTKKL